MKKRIYLSHPYGGFLENREKAAALAKMYREIWDAEGKTDWELVNPIEYFAPLAEDGVDDETILKILYHYRTYLECCGLRNFGRIGDVILD